jgi:AcrR family transcriptional regulator
MEHDTDPKERIRRAAARLWAQQGYHATGMRELSEAVGLGRAALYHHIGSKEDLLFEISTLYVKQLVAQAEPLLARGDTAASAKLRMMSRVLMRNIADNLPEWTVFFHEANTLTGAYRDSMLAYRVRYEGLWNALVEEGVRSGEFRRTNIVVVKGLLGMHNYSYLWLRTGDRLTAEDIADEFTSVILRGLLSDDGLTEILATRAGEAVVAH